MGMEFADSAAGGSRVETFLLKNPTEDMLKRDLKLALEQKNQADKLVEALTKRCDTLRQALLAQRNEAADKNNKLVNQLNAEQDQNSSLVKANTDALSRIACLEAELVAVRDTNIQLRKIAEMALEEADDLVSELQFHRS